MCNYITGLSLQSPEGNWSKNFVHLSIPLLSTLAVRFLEEDDNRGSGR